MSPTSPEREPKRHRRAALIALGIGIALLFALVFSQAAFNLTFLRPSTSEQTLTLTALSAVIFLLLVALSFVLIRNLVKLGAERRVGKVGSKFRTRMVTGALVLSFTPVLFMFLFAYGLMNRSIDKWFSRPVEQMREDSGEIARLLSSYAAENAQAEATSIARLPDSEHAFQTGNFNDVMATFRRRVPSLQGGFALALVEDDAVASYHAPLPWGALREKILSVQPDKRLAPLEIAGRSYMVGSEAVGANGRVIVALPLPDKFMTTLQQMDQNQRAYFELSRERKLVRRTYMGLLLLLTVTVLFAATWLSLFLAKLVTRPVAALAEAMQEISRGRLDYRVEVTASDELGALVTSFNRMAAELESSRTQIEASSRQLGDANVALEQRRSQIETILESIPTGVLSLDANRRVTHSNAALQRLFSPQGGARTFASGSTLRELFTEDVATDLDHMMRKADRMGSTTSQLEIAVPRGRLSIAVTIASLQHRGQRQGYVVVFEDLSELLKAQKQAAWREVARRVAHEIKNPLTPIALSAERIRRHLDRGSAPDEASIAVIQGCTDTIDGAVETVRKLVDEFSTLARFPASQPHPANVNEIVEGTLSLFNGRLDNIHVEMHLASELPQVLADPEAMKRAFANLVDNAAEAVQESLVREVHISTSLLSSRDAVEIVVADTGHGVTREVKEKLFLPYFSTKRRGTGLGLAIVSRIVEDHHGSIRVEENSPMGTRFIVELPLADKDAPVERVN
ncbi:MAG: HAMP domain-containing protein [Acidobacteriia bacterium]|nr:HAMP domain-containing protein [Terriglobia bacterium]